jgi:hypothetical protein
MAKNTTKSYAGTNDVSANIPFKFNTGYQTAGMLKNTFIDRKAINDSRKDAI